MSVAGKGRGLSTPEPVDAAVAGGARYVGFVFFPPSPRYVTPETARELGGRVPDSVSRVAVVVDLDDAELTSILDSAAVDLVQLHGTETPERVAEIRKRFGKPVIKSISVASEQDLEAKTAYEDAADMLLFDAKAKASDTRPGGNARTFDWSLLKGRLPRSRWLLSGGLTADNVGEAVHATGASLVDVSSGVESAPGVKDANLIAAFLAAANDL